MTLMGSWIMGVQKANAANGQGLSDEAVAYRRFPLVAGGRGKPTDTFGGVNGWAVTRSAPAPTLDLLHALTSSLYERTMCERNVYLPAVRGLSQVLTSTVLRQVAAEIDASTYHLLFLDQTLGSIARQRRERRLVRARHRRYHARGGCEADRGCAPGRGYVRPRCR